ncbi:unnamed protein product [Trichogramma brassicae]|uniref:Smr domain-containing protein n=1 Tax=Trichogramma brassicae TaxID=86971 RepID=A0A6H5IGZ1_9HYME|nr:unnamed protein product [Trichogramma brassicae]
MKIIKYKKPTAIPFFQPQYTYTTYMTNVKRSRVIDASATSTKTTSESEYYFTILRPTKNIVSCFGKIVSNIHAFDRFFELIIGAEYGYKIKTLEPRTSWAKNPRELERRNTHDIPLIKINQMLNRFEANISGERLLRIYGITYQPHNRPPQLRDFPPLELNKRFEKFEKSLNTHKAKKGSKKFCERNDAKHQKEKFQNSSPIDNRNLIDWKDSGFPVSEITLPLNISCPTIEKSVEATTQDKGTYTEPYDFNIAYIGVDHVEDSTYSFLTPHYRDINQNDRRSEQSTDAEYARSLEETEGACALNQTTDQQKDKSPNLKEIMDMEMALAMCTDSNRQIDITPPGGERDVFIITGRGSNSLNGCKIRPAVTAALKNKNIRAHQLMICKLTLISCLELYSI